MHQVLLPLLANADAAVVVESASEPVGWVSIVITALAAVVVPFITNYLNKAAEAKKAELDCSNLNKKQRIAMAVQAHAYDRAAAFVERDFLVLAKMITTGEIKDKDKVKDYLRNLGNILRDDLIVFAKEQFGVDILTEYGTKLVNGWIESAANRVSPFPGKDTAESLLQGGAQRLIKNGVGRLLDNK